MTATVVATRTARYGAGQQGRVVHRVRQIIFYFGKGGPWGEWQRPFRRAVWMCGTHSTRPELFDAIDGHDARCRGCFR